MITSSGTGPTARDAAGLLWDIGRPTVTRAGWPYELQYHHGIPQLVHIPSVTSDPELGRVIGYKIAGTVAAIVLDPVSYTHLDVYKRQRLTPLAGTTSCARSCPRNE